MTKIIEVTKLSREWVLENNRLCTLYFTHYCYI